MALITMSHPDVAGTAQSTLEAFLAIHQPRGWVLVPDPLVPPLPAPMRFDGLWDAAQYYEAGNTVVEAGVTYVCLVANRNAPPPQNTALWQPLRLTRSETTLRNIRAALGRRSNDAVDVLVVGDSFVGNFRRTQPTKRFYNHLRDAAQRRWAGATQGSGYHPCAPDVGVAESNWTFGGSPAAFPGFGLARMSTGLSTGAHSATLVVTCDRFHLAYGRTSSTGTLGVRIDGGAITNIATAGSPNKSTRLWDSGPLSAGSHTVTVTWVSGGIVLLEGLMAYNGDFASGVRFWDSGYGGDQAATHTAPGTFYYSGLDNVKPDLILVHFGTNERIANLPAETFSANLKGLVDLIRSFCPAPLPSVAVLLPWATAGFGGQVTVEKWSSYRTAIKTLCVQQGYELLDMFDVAGEIGSPTDVLGVTEPDLLHPNASGAQWYADEIIRTILR